MAKKYQSKKKEDKSYRLSSASDYIIGRLLHTGLFGDTRDEVADRLITRYAFDNANQLEKHYGVNLIDAQKAAKSALKKKGS